MKILKIFLASLFLLAVVIGCDGDNGGSGAGGGDPCAELAEAAECPCDYDQVPFECWESEAPLPPSWTPCAHTDCATPGDFCGIDFFIGSDVATDRVLENFNSPAGKFCSFITINSGPRPCASDIVMPPIDDQQFATCLCRLAHYANRAAQAGVPISGTGPPFSCQPSTPPDQLCIPLGEGKCSSNLDCCDNAAECVDRVCCLASGKQCQDNSQCCSGDCELCFGECDQPTEQTTPCPNSSEHGPTRRCYLLHPVGQAAFRCKS